MFQLIKLPAKRCVYYHARDRWKEPLNLEQNLVRPSKLRFHFVELVNSTANIHKIKTNNISRALGIDTSTTTQQFITTSSLVYVAHVPRHNS